MQWKGSLLPVEWSPTTPLASLPAPALSCGPRGPRWDHRPSRSQHLHTDDPSPLNSVALCSKAYPSTLLLKHDTAEGQTVERGAGGVQGQLPPGQR